MLGHGALGTYARGAPKLPSAGQRPVPYYFADRAFITEPDDSPPNQLWQPIVSQPFKMESTLPLSPLDQRRAILRVGQIGLVNDGRLDKLTLKYPIDGRKVEVKVGAPGFRMDQFRTLFKGTATGWSGGSDGESNAFATLKDNSTEFEAPLQKNLYDGTGGAGGGPELTGLPIPLCMGICRDITPPMIDQGALVGQVHDGPVHAITDVSDRGVAFTYAGDVPDIWATTVAPGEYKTQLSNGYFKLGTFNGNSYVTCTVYGDASYDRYVDTTAGIIFRGVHDRLGWPDSRFRISQFQAMRTALRAPVGFYTELKAYTVSQFLDQLTAAVGFWWGIDSEGLLGIGRMTRADAVASYFLDDRHITSVSQLEPPSSINPPLYEVKIGAQKRWTDLGGNFAAGILPDRRRFLSQPYRYPAPSRDISVRVQHPLAQTITLQSYLDNLDDAKAVQDTILADFKQLARRVRVNLKSKGYFLPIGGTVNVNHRRYDLDGGRNGRITGHGVDTSNNSSFVEVWY